MSIIQGWFNEDSKWVVMALLFGLAVLLLVALPGSARALRQAGARK